MSDIGMAMDDEVRENFQRIGADIKALRDHFDERFNTLPCIGHGERLATVEQITCNGQAREAAGRQIERMATMEGRMDANQASRKDENARSKRFTNVMMVLLTGAIVVLSIITLLKK